VLITVAVIFTFPGGQYTEGPTGGSTKTAKPSQG